MAVSATRQRRIRRVQALRSQGLSSSEIGRRLNLAPSTVRDYWGDPLRKKARVRQRRYGVSPAIHMPRGVITSVKAPTKRWHPAGKPNTEAGAKARNRQMRAVIGSYARR